MKYFEYRKFSDTDVDESEYEKEQDEIDKIEQHFKMNINIYTQIKNFKYSRCGKRWSNSTVCHRHKKTCGDFCKHEFIVGNCKKTKNIFEDLPERFPDTLRFTNKINILKLTERFMKMKFMKIYDIYVQLYFCLCHVLLYRSVY